MRKPGYAICKWLRGLAGFDVIIHDAGWCCRRRSSSPTLLGRVPNVFPANDPPLNRQVIPSLAVDKLAGTNCASKVRSSTSSRAFWLTIVFSSAGAACRCLSGNGVGGGADCLETRWQSKMYFQQPLICLTKAKCAGGCLPPRLKFSKSIAWCAKQLTTGGFALSGKTTHARHKPVAPARATTLRTLPRWMTTISSATWRIDWRSLPHTERSWQRHPPPGRNRAARHWDWCACPRIACQCRLSVAPVLLDGCFQAMGATFPASTVALSAVGLSRRIHRKPGATLEPCSAASIIGTTARGRFATVVARRRSGGDIDGRNSTPRRKRSLEANKTQPSPSVCRIGSCAGMAAPASQPPRSLAALHLPPLADPCRSRRGGRGVAVADRGRRRPLHADLRRGKVCGRGRPKLHALPNCAGGFSTVIDNAQGNCQRTTGGCAPSVVARCCASGRIVRR